jgi:hypothetical protein
MIVTIIKVASCSHCRAERWLHEMLVVMEEPFFGHGTGVPAKSVG